MYYFSRIKHRRLFLEPQCKKGLSVVQNPESVKGKTDKGDLHKCQELLHGKNYHKQGKWGILLLLIQRMGLISLTYKEFLHFKRKRLIIQ